MAMDFFKKERKCNAFMKNVKGKMVKMKAGSGTEGARKKVVIIEFEIPITSKIRELLDPRLAALINLDGAENGPEREFPINSMDPARQIFPAIVTVYSKANFNKDAKPIWSQGGADKESQASICLKKVAIKEDKALLKVEVITNFSDDVWNWAGESLDGSDCVLKFKPLQGELFTEDEKADEEGEGESNEEDVRPESLKKKEKEKAGAVA